MNPGESTGITVAAKRGDLGEIKKILRKRPEAIAESDSSGWNALHAAACGDQRDTIRYLLKRGTPINVATSTGMTPLFLATFKGHGEVVELLVEHGANMNVQDDKGDSPMHCAYSWGHDAIVAILQGNGADELLVNRKGKRPADVARYKRKVFVPARRGMRVEGNYRGAGVWYPGSISFARLNHSFDIAYDDGEAERAVPLECVRAIGGASLFPAEPNPPRRLVLGDVVEVNYNESGEWYPGMISRVGPDRMYDVQYDDGEHGINIRKRLIRFLHEGKSAAVAADPVLAVGERVEVRYRGQSVWFPGTVRNVGPNGIHDVTYDNGQWEPVERENLRLVDEDRKKELARKAQILEDAKQREQDKKERVRRRAAAAARKEAAEHRAAAQLRAAEGARGREAESKADQLRLKAQRREDAAQLAALRAQEDAAIASARNQEDDEMESAHQLEVDRVSGLGGLHSAIENTRAKARKDRIDALNLIDATMKEEIEFVKNDERITPVGKTVVSRVAEILLKYPELRVHIESHTNCFPGQCSEGCVNRRLSQARVDNVRDALEQTGCKNAFMTKGWGCKHPSVGAHRVVKIFPEDINYDDEEMAKEEVKLRVEKDARAVAKEVVRLEALLDARRSRLHRQRKKEDLLRAARRQAESDAIRADIDAQDIRAALEKQRQDRIDALNLIEDTMREEIDFVSNDSGITAEGRLVCRKVANILLQYPELQIHIESHTSCKPGRCTKECHLMALSQERVDNVRDALIDAGCVNKFMTKGWGCRHPKVGAERVVKIYPEDLEYSMDDGQLRVAEKNAFQAAKALKVAVAKDGDQQLLRAQERVEDDRVAKTRAREDKLLSKERKLEDAARAKKFEEDVKAAKIAGKFQAVVDEARSKARQDRIDALNLIEDTMREEIEFVKNEAALTYDGYAVCMRVADVLVRYPELLIHVEGHTSCRKGICDGDCRNMDLSQRRVENVRDALIDSGSQNSFIAKGWGCKHPEIGAERCVKIFPEDLEWEEEERRQAEDALRAKEAIHQADEEVRRLTQQMSDREIRIAQQRADDDARRDVLRRDEDEERSAKRIAIFQANKDQARRKRQAALDTIEDNMKEDVSFVKNEKNMTPEGAAVIKKVAQVLHEYPELQIHIEGHTSCKKGHCNLDCRLLRLSQARVETVRDALVYAGCTNIFMTKGWGCRQPEVGAVRTVKIFPEDLIYDY